MSIGTEEGDTNRVDGAESADDGADEVSVDDKKPSNQNLDLSPSNCHATICDLLQHQKNVFLGILT